MTDVKLSKDAMRDYAVSWNKRVREAWQEPYLTSLSSEFESLNVKSILDCAGGTGFPSIELKQMGWDVSYSDGSNEMVSFFKHRLEEEALDIPAYSSRWEDLSENVPHTYDALMCAGNSFITIATYENTEHSIQKESVTKLMRLAALEFYKMLNEGGVLYIDLLKDAYVTPEQPYSFGVNMDNQRMFTTISYDSVRNIRTALSTVISLADNSEVDCITKYAPLFCEELLALLKDVGFSRIERSKIKGADYVDGFLAFKD